MVNIMENPIKMDDLGGKPTIFGNTQLVVEPTHLKNMSQIGSFPNLQGWQ